MNELNVQIKLENEGRIPTYGRDGDACLDCYSNADISIPSGERKLIGLGFSLAIPLGYEGVLRPRSGMTKNGIDVGIGTIDSNYRGVCKACLINNSNATYEVKKGDRVCQLAIREIPKIEWNEVEELDSTNRNDSGFGSSGR